MFLIWCFSYLYLVSGNFGFGVILDESYFDNSVSNGSDEYCFLPSLLTFSNALIVADVVVVVILLIKGNFEYKSIINHILLRKWPAKSAWIFSHGSKAFGHWHNSLFGVSGVIWIHCRQHWPCSSRSWFIFGHPIVWFALFRIFGIPIWLLCSNFNIVGWSVFGITVFPPIVIKPFWSFRFCRSFSNSFNSSSLYVWVRPLILS